MTRMNRLKYIDQGSYLSILTANQKRAEILIDIASARDWIQLVGSEKDDNPRSVSEIFISCHFTSLREVVRLLDNEVIRFQDCIILYKQPHKPVDRFKSLISSGIKTLDEIRKEFGLEDLPPEEFRQRPVLKYIWTDLGWTTAEVPGGFSRGVWLPGER